MIIDFNAHFGAGPSSMEWHSASELLAIEMGAGIDITIASDLATAFHDAAFDDAPLPEGLIAFASLNPSFRPYDLPPAKGLRIYPSYHDWSVADDAVARLLAIAREHSLIVQVCLRLRDPRALPVTVPIPDAISQIREMVSGNDDILFVTSGMSFAEIKANLALCDRPNVWIDISHVQHPTNSLPKLLDTIDVSRVLFGSGAPVLYPYANVYRVMNSAIPDESRQRILYKNAQELLGAMQWSISI